ncbi:dephospho-CoA kinase [Meridianimarinicoccus roseus]|uniref:Dephospho-CoA kinase n=1 Tax=Meridianimarinicoccus roseus TaxID=2072018 RepID=A0A2V2LBK5_9RHOB|nr:dephospho-CoA kinase [Meridianimarinicoccus roseus]PWR02890.1 dephospho-CoA kinase [Meridianimarinicoccus roseus]
MTRPFRLGLTGSIGMGKSTTARMFAEAGCAVWDADAAVHRLYGPRGAAVSAIAALHPAAIVDGAVSRDVLKVWIRNDPAALSRIEAVVHPLVAADRADFLAATDADIAVFDIPLLFEGGSERGFDAVAVVTAPPETQRARVLARPGMTEEQFESLLAKQLPDADKRARSDFVIETDDMASAQIAVSRIVKTIRAGHA